MPALKREERMQRVRLVNDDYLGRAEVRRIASRTRGGRNQLVLRRIYTVGEKWKVYRAARFAWEKENAT